MPRYVKASEFSGQAVVRSSERAPTHRVIRGVPTNVNGTMEHLAAMYVMLVETGEIPADASNQNNDLKVAEMCLEALSITSAVILPSEPKKTFRTDTRQPSNNADENNNMGKKVIVNPGQTKDGHTPSSANVDPIYELDQQPDNYVQKIREIDDQQNQNDKKCLMFMASEIARLNFNPDFAGNFKLAQFEALTHYGVLSHG
jgi:hypothetical protein